ncbi:iron chaperone [Pseudochryseolinea flava]|uniref:DUF1801 domain-containing protein n=1 Tax=Pseudochryseolinea flava TaxID=2059302 RepID=A0A364XWR3_9BACT|nr:DUF1801 domain-containing protein [Pseudochryseolinea flava]RAV97973.1 DUF1801 domain-containing protein [Pseudochryseolinea flava]
MSKSQKFERVKDYIESLPEDSQRIIKKLRTFIKKQIPEAEEVISYNMPAFRIADGVVIWYAAFKEHVSVFPRSSKLKSLAAFDGGKGTVKFPNSQPLPFDVIEDFIKVRLKEVAADKKAKTK